MDCVDDGPWTKHRFRQRASFFIAGLLSLLHLAIAIKLIAEKCLVGPILLVFTFFGCCLIFDRKVASNLKLVWGYQAILMVVSAYATVTCANIIDEARVTHVQVPPRRHRFPQEENIRKNPNTAEQESTFHAEQENNQIRAQEAELAHSFSTSHEDNIHLPRKKLRRIPERPDRRSGQGPPPVNPEVPLGTDLDLYNASLAELRDVHPQLFADLPTDGFMPKFKNPCWGSSSSLRNQPMQCLPYAYILGLPKCGSSDLWERLNKHPKVMRADRKEVRFFTRGEFASHAPEDGFLPPSLSLREFTKHHTRAARMIASQTDESMQNAIIIDGGPHTLWWSVQEPDGSWPLDHARAKQMPIPLLLHALQPQARFLVTLAEPVRRMHSDYYFLNANGVARGTDGKSPEDFDIIATEQIASIRRCFKERSLKDGLSSDDYNVGSKLSLYAEQSCAYDRYHFGRPGSGRLCIGLYHAFLSRWFQVFSRDQFLVLRLEDFNAGRKNYIENIFSWLDLPQVSQSEWEEILVDRTFNEHMAARRAILPSTESKLREFYAPFNARLAELLDARFTWEDVWKSKTQMAAVMHSRWEHDEIPDENTEEKWLSAHHLHDPRTRFHEGQGNHDHKFPELRDKEAQRRRERDWERDRPERRLPPEEDGGHFSGGREALNDMPVDTIQRDGGAFSLCLASMGLHLGALRQFLATPGVSAQSVLHTDNRRTALHCLGSVWVFGDSLRESYIFSLLAGDKHWLDQVLDPPVERGQASYGMFHLVDGVKTIVRSIAKTLLDGGADPNAFDASGRTPLHYAALGGLESLAEELLAAGADPNLVDHRHRQTPLHSCATHGHPKLARLMIENGARIDIRDVYGNTFVDIATAVGSAISLNDLRDKLGFSKMKPKRLPPSSETEATLIHGDGGWMTDLLPPKFSRNASYVDTNGRSDPEGSQQYCDLDMLEASETNPDIIFNEYIMMNRPVLIRGLNTDSPAWESYKMKELRREFGKLSVHVSDIPYNNKFGSSNGAEMTLQDYIDKMMTHRVDGEDKNHPWYVFKGHPVPHMSDARDSLVNPSTIPIPTLMHKLFMMMPEARSKPRPPKNRLQRLFNRGNQHGDIIDAESEESNYQEQVERRRPFVNLQWALGTAGSGAPVHFHNTAWNQLFYGRKHWYLYPPSRNLMGKKQVMDWLEHDIRNLMEDGFQPMECIQMQGDVLVVPELWGHAVLNVQDSVAVASEVRGSNYRLTLPRAYRDLVSHDKQGRERGRRPRPPR